jgi:leucyl-tRNA synthetase
MSKQYDPNIVEAKWQKIWDQTELYRTDETRSNPKYYQLEFFPYPSGVTMHVGHVRNYVISDAHGRFKRMQGYNLLHPMGWDAFGLPAENQAIKTGLSPRESTEQNIEIFKRQLGQMGLSFDWSREINSSEPDYYRWTQWFFLLFHKMGLAYKAESLVWWCPHDKTVLANEQVVKQTGQNVCERCGHEVTKRSLNQWFFKITAYADRLLEDLKAIDWPENIKTMQSNWIGRSRGAKIKFEVNGTKEIIEVFTTRPDTIYGATFMVLAPEHQLVGKITSPQQKSAVKSYQKEAAKASEIERQATERAKTGVFTGAQAINPATGEKIPVWVGDYVLMGYGTGAIMAVPAHDERDYEFAQKFNLPIKVVIEPVTGKAQPNPEQRQSIVAVVRDPKTDKLLSINWGEKGGNLFVGGGIGEGEDPLEAAKREVAEETGYQNLKLVARSERIHHNYFAHSKNVARAITALGFYFELADDAKIRPKLEHDERGKFIVEWLSPAEAGSRVGDELHQRLFEQFIFQKPYSGDGILTESGKHSGLASAEARKQICKDLDEAESTINYRMRDWLISRQRYWGAPIPIIYCDKCGVIPVPEQDLPVELPNLSDFHPDDSGRSPLAKVKDWINTSCPKCGGAAQRETDTMDTFVDSSWYFLRFADPKNDRAAFAKDKVEYWLPVDTYVGGAEHAVAHLLYARFWTKVLQDAKLVDFSEPFKRLRNQGMIGGADGRKMGKRYGNVVTPDDVINQGYGADALRLAELFIGPYNQAVDWNPRGIDGTYRFIRRIWTLVQDFVETKLEAGESQSSHELEAALLAQIHRAIKKVTSDIDNFSFNTAVAALMELVNELYKLRVDLPFGQANDTWELSLRTLVQLLAPFAPHVAEELWADLGGQSSVHISKWPKYEEKYVKEELLEIPIQVNGKLRGTLTVDPATSEAELKKLAAEQPNVKTHLKGKTIAKTVIVPRKLVSFVIK